MKYLTILLALLFVMPALADFVYICDDSEIEYADWFVYVCDDDEYAADMEDSTIYLTVEDADAAVDDEEIWFLVDDPDYADYFVYITYDPEAADEWVYFLDWDE